MEKVLLSGTELYVSPIALGTDSYGLLTNEEESYALLDEFFSLGGNVLDTALIYSDWVPGEKSRSEKLLGRWMKYRGRRDDVIISTKGSHPDFATMNVHRLSDADIRGDLEKSLKHLGTDYIDIYWLHRDAEELPVDGIMDTLGSFVKEGKVRYIGVSNWTNKRIAAANEYAVKNNLPLISSSQIQYSVAEGIKEMGDPTLVLMNDEEYKFFTDTKMPVFAFESQAKGFFSKLDTLGIEEVKSKKAYARFMTEKNLKRFEIIKELSVKYSVSVAEIVIAALCSNEDFQTIPIAGCKNSAHLQSSASGASLKLTQQEVDSLIKL